MGQTAARAEREAFAQGAAQDAAEWELASKGTGSADTLRTIVEASGTKHIRFLYIRMTACMDGATMTYEERRDIEGRAYDMGQYDTALAVARELSRDYRGFTARVELLDTTGANGITKKHYINSIAWYTRGERVR